MTKSYLLLILHCLLPTILAMSGLGADAEIEKTTSVHSSTWKVEVFLRLGETNLVCDTRTIGDSLHRTWTFYQNEVKVGQLTTSPDLEEFRSEIGSKYSVSFRIKAPENTGFVYVTDSNGIAVNIFTYKRGLYLPAGRKVIQEMMKGQKELLQHVRDTVE